MLKTLSMSLILFLLVACNNKLDLTVSSKIILPTEPYILVGRSAANFGVGGVAQFGNPLAATRMSATEMSFETTDGSRYQVGYSEAPSNRFRSLIYKVDGETGVLDSSFGSGGYFNIPSELATATDENYVSHGVLVKDRYLLLCGMENTGGVTRAAVRLFDTSSGSLVTSFGGNGIVILPSPDATRPHSWNQICDYDSQNDRFVISYHIFSNSYDSYPSFIRVLDWSGNDVVSFNGGSELPITHPSLNDVLKATTELISTATHYYIFGFQHDLTWSYQQSFIAKYNKAGVLDNTFGSNGVSFFVPSNNAAAVSVLSGAVDGKDGYFYSSTYDVTYANKQIARISQTTGALDTGFGSSGYLDFKALVTPSLGPFVNFSISKVDFADDGKLVVLWDDEDFPVISQLNLSHQLDADFGTDGSVTLPTLAGTTKAWTWGMSRNADGTFEIHGACFDGSNLRRYCQWKIE